MKWQSNHDGWIKEKQLHLINPEQLIMMKQMQTQQKQTNMEYSMCEITTSNHVCCVHVGTSLLWFISGQAWLSEGMEGDLLGVTSTGEPEYPTSAVASGTSGYERLDTD